MKIRVGWPRKLCIWNEIFRVENVKNFPQGGLRAIRSQFVCYRDKFPIFPNFFSYPVGISVLWTLVNGMEYDARYADLVVSFKNHTMQI